jgi:hypothetical protein
LSLPGNGAVDVPTNARVWWLFRDTPPSGGPLGALQPFTAYNLPWYHINFVTGAGPDHEPPAQPNIGVFSIVVTGGSAQDLMNVGSLHIAGGFSADTAVLRVRLTDGERVTTYYMPAREPLICEPGFRLHAGTIHAEITAIDLAGNESPPTTYDATSTIVTPFVSSCPRTELGLPAQAHEPADRMASAAVYGPLGLDMVAGLVILIVTVRRSRTRTSAIIEPIPITAAEQIARRIRLGSAVAAISLVVTVAAIAPLDIRLAGALAICSPLLLAALWTALASWWAAVRMLRITEQDAAATVHHDVVEVVVADRRSSLRCSRRLIARSRQDALPRATSL